jgi:hypothetical protein
LAALVKVFDEPECRTRITEQNIKEEQEGYLLSPDG